MKQLKAARAKPPAPVAGPRVKPPAAPAAAAATAVRPRHRIARRWAVAGAVLGLALLGVAIAYRGLQLARAPGPAEIAFRGNDPLVEQAIRDARDRVQRARLDADAWGHFGKVLLAHHYDAEAAAAFARAEALDPSEPRWPYYAALSLGDERYDESIPKLRRSVELLGNNEPDPVPRLRLVETLLRRGDLDDAERVLLDVLSRDRNHPRALLGLGQVAAARGQYDDARRHLELAARNAPDARPVFALLANTYARLGETGLAARATERSRQLPSAAQWEDPWLAELNPLRTGLNALLDQADALVAGGAAAEALAPLERATRTYPTSGRAWRTYGFALLNAGRPADAEAPLRRATEVSPADDAAHVLLAHALVRTRRPADAEAPARRAIELQPASGEAYTILGIALHSQRRIDEAGDALRQALGYRPDLAEAHLAMADLLVTLGRMDDAIAQLRDGVARAANDHNLRHRLAELEGPPPPPTAQRRPGR